MNMSNCNLCEGCNEEVRREAFNTMKEKYSAITSFSYNYYEHSQPISLLLGVTNRCNLNCSYCFVEQNPMDMPLSVAEKAIEWVKTNRQKKNISGKPMVNFFGGEPLLRYKDLIKPLVEKYGKEIEFGITTNGVLLDENVVDFFYKNKINILLSFDGIPSVQNKQRSNSFNEVLKNIPYLLLRYPNVVMRSTLTKASIPYLYDTVLMAEELGFKKIVFCPNEFEIWDKEEEKELLAQFKKIGLYIYKALMKGKIPIMVDPLNSDFNKTNLAIENNLKFNNTIMRCGLGTTGCAITPDGKIVPCQEKISHPTIILGDLDSGIDKNIHKAFLIDYFEKVNNISCDKGCSEKIQLNCVSDLCPSRLEDLNFALSSPHCVFTRMSNQVANRLHYLCAHSYKDNIRNYFSGGGQCCG